jgi:hypothetical protein
MSRDSIIDRMRDYSDWFNGKNYQLESKKNWKEVLKIIEHRRKLKEKNEKNNNK